MKIIRVIALIVILCVLSSCSFAANTNSGEISTEPELISPYENLTDPDADITLPKSEQFSWYKKPYLKASDMRAVKDCFYRITTYKYIDTEYAAYYVGDKCGLVNSNGEILCEPLYTEPEYCPEAVGITLNGHDIAYELRSQSIVPHGGHGGGWSTLYYDLNTSHFICISGSEGENCEVDYEINGTYIVLEATLENKHQYYETVYYDNIDDTGKIGLYNNGQLVIPFEYTAASEISEDIVAMYDGSEWTYFSTDGTVIMENVEPNSDSISYYEKTNEDEYTEITIPCVFSYSCGCVPVKKDGKWGYMDKNGKMIIDAVFDNALPAFENRAWVCIEGYWGIIEI